MYQFLVRQTGWFEGFPPSWWKWTAGTSRAQHPNNDNTVTPMVARCGLVSPVLAPSLAARGTAVFGSAGFGSAVSHQSSMLETQRLEVGIWIAHVHRVTMGYYGLPKHFPLVEGLVHTQKKNLSTCAAWFSLKKYWGKPKSHADKQLRREDENSVLGWPIFGGYVNVREFDVGGNVNCKLNSDFGDRKQLGNL